MRDDPTKKVKPPDEENAAFIRRCRQITRISCMHRALWAMDVLQQTHGCDEPALDEVRRLLAKEVLEDAPRRERRVGVGQPTEPTEPKD